MSTFSFAHWCIGIGNCIVVVVVVYINLENRVISGSIIIDIVQPNTKIKV